MNITIDYDEKVAYVENAVHPNGIEYDMKYIKKKLQDFAKNDDMYGLEFWNYQFRKKGMKPGCFVMEIFDPFRRI